MSDDADTMGMEDDEIAYLVAAEKAKWADDLTADDVDSIVAAARRGLMRAAATEDRRKVSVPQPPLFRYCAFCACGYEWQEGWSDKCGGCTRAESANEAAKRMMEQVDEMAEQRVERNANIKLLRAELAEMKIDRNDWKRISDEAEFRAEVAEAEVARLAQGVTAQAEEARMLREAAMALYERVQMDESVGICLSERVTTLALGRTHREQRPRVREHRRSESLDHRLDQRQGRLSPRAEGRRMSRLWAYLAAVVRGWRQGGRK